MANNDPHITPRLLKGFRDTLPRQLLVRNQLIQMITQTVTNFGFQPLETPALEYADILHGKLGDEGEKLLYRFADHGGRDVAMRYDFTIPLARVSAQYPDLPKPFKRYQVGPVWRADNTQRGRFREFYQYDLDIVGTDAIVADAEILVLMQEILLSLGAKGFKIRVNDRRTMVKIANSYKLNDTQQKTFFTGLDKYDKIGADGVLKYWHDNSLNVFEDSNFIESFEKIIDPSNEGGELGQILDKAEALGLKKQYYQIDPTIVRGLDYYTGIVFETTLNNAPGFGSIFSGGRYDNLIGRFAKQDVPAVGASVGLDRLIAAMEALDILPASTNPVKVFVIVFSQDLEGYSFNLVHALRQAGIATELSCSYGNLGKQMKTASSKDIPYVAIAGPDEIADQKLVLRDLRDGSQQNLDIDSAIHHIKADMTGV